jgi:DNA/RNA-binding protein KIN17
VLNPSVGRGRFYRKKARIFAVRGGGFVAKVRLLDGNGKIKVDQEELETVLPAPGGTVLVVRGAFRGERGVLLGVEEDRFVARVELSVSRRSGDGGSARIVELAYEDVCKCLEY